MNKYLQILLTLGLISIPLGFYAVEHGHRTSGQKIEVAVVSRGVEARSSSSRPQVALIFDDLGGSLREIKDIYSLDVPVTVAVIPGLKFSKNVAHIAKRCGFSVLIHLPLAPKRDQDYAHADYQFIGAHLSRTERESLLRYYLGSISIAMGANNHMGSAATEDSEVMEQVIRALERKDMIFVDSRTSLKSVACEVAQREQVPCYVNNGFVDSVHGEKIIEKKFEKLMSRAREKRKIIIIAHPKKDTMRVLKKMIPRYSSVDFITLEEYAAQR
ncbi:MAG: hypothetical protein GF333_05990 [Candidatus Omnitrophica bacterium]|nr:hypothetical protein [Candidatus Omnitrophota bacterium]